MRRCRDCPRRLATALVVLAVLAPFTQARASAEIGVVVLHGKAGMGGGGNMVPFIRALERAGFSVQAPTMCWSRTRIYDAPFPDCLREIDTSIAALRAAGARRIVVAGQSLGGNAALVYGAQHPELAGVIALAPAGQPEQSARNRDIARSLAQARQMVAAGQGNQRASFADISVGEAFTVTTTPAIYVSFFQPGGPADFPALLPRVRVPVIWVAGSQDRAQDMAASLFDRLPANPLNRLVPVAATHRDTPEAGAAAALDWLRTLPAR